VSHKNVEVVREILRLWNAREPTDHLVAADLEYVNPPDAIEGGTRPAQAALRGILEVYPDFRVEVERVVDAGDDVVVVGVAHGTGASGIATHSRQGHVWTLRDGRATRIRWFRDPAEAFRAVGLEE
jgi:ketosteroid isomerase-like protein